MIFKHHFDTCRREMSICLRHGKKRHSIVSVWEEKVLSNKKGKSCNRYRLAVQDRIMSGEARKWTGRRSQKREEDKEFKVWELRKAEWHRVIKQLSMNCPCLLLVREWAKKVWMLKFSSFACRWCFSLDPDGRDERLGRAVWWQRRPAPVHIT